MRITHIASSMVLCAAMVFGCSDEDGEPATTADTADITATQPDTEAAPQPDAEAASQPDTEAASQPDTESETAAPGAPLFLTFNSNTQALPSDGVLVFTAILTHPEGVSQVIGGTLLDPGTGSSYGAFITQATQGTYTLSLTWSQINTVAAINAPPDGAPRTFRATFFDQRGHEASRDLAIQLVCAPASDAACAGECVDLESSTQHCGACDVAAARCDGGVPACANLSKTLCASGCKYLDGDVDHCGACDNECPTHEFGIDRTCTQSRCGFSGTSYEPITCTDFCGKHDGTCERASLHPFVGDSFAVSCDQVPDDSNFDYVVCYCRD